MKYFWVSLVLIIGFASCDSMKSKEDFSSTPALIVERILEKYPDGSVKAVEEYQIVDGVQVIYGYKEFYISGKVKIEGKYNSDNQRDGLWEAYFENGNNWSIGTYTNGEENGEKKVWYENGKLRYTGEMKNNKPTGEWHVWDESEEETIKNF